MQHFLNYLMLFVVYSLGGDWFFEVEDEAGADVLEDTRSSTLFPFLLIGNKLVLLFIDEENNATT